MNKVLAVARAEYLQAVRSKAFVIGVILMPVMMGGSIAAQILLKDQVDLRTRHCAIVDPAGDLFEVLGRAAERRNDSGVWKVDETGERTQVRPFFELERYEPAEGERADVTLSRRVRDDVLDAFLMIPANAAGPIAADGDDAPFVFHTDTPTYTELPTWMETTLNDELRERRFEAAQIDRELVSRLDRRVPLATFGLVTERGDGTVEAAKEENEIATFGVPAGAMFLLFILVMTAAPTLLNQVLEEKMQRISEVLVSAVTPFQLLLGKLLGGVAISLTLGALYLAGVAWATIHYGVGDLVPPQIYAWFVLLLVLALLMYGSVFSALGSACSELRDAQSMMMPAMLLFLIPLFAWTAILESPNGTVARALTFFPTATPMVLLLRVAAPPGPETWEILLSLALCLATTVGLVAAGGKIFRIGLLAQGQTPSLRQVLGWLVR